MALAVALLALALFVGSGLGDSGQGDGGQGASSAVLLGVDSARCVAIEASCGDAANGVGVALQLNSQMQNSSVHIPALHGHWDLSGYASVSVDVTNLEAYPVAVFGRLDGHLFGAATAVFLEPNGTEEMLLHVARPKPFPGNLSDRFPKMNGVPGGIVWGWDTEVSFSNVSAIWIDVQPPGPSDRPARRLLLENFRASRWNVSCGAKAASPYDDEIFPLVDRYGQLTYKDWPTKVRADSDLLANKQREADDLAAYPGPEGWNVFGGWAAGPTLNATGHYRTAKHAGRWWFVDPVGKLFWSAGVTCVEISSHSSTAGREQFFEDSGEYGSFDAVQANLRRKYGPSDPNFNETGAGYNDTVRELAHLRLRSWGLNTMVCSFT